MLIYYRRHYFNHPGASVVFISKAKDFWCQEHFNEGIFASLAWHHATNWQLDISLQLFNVT